MILERQQVNLRLERGLIDSLDELANREGVDRTEMARRILVDGMAQARLSRALRDYADERVTAWKAAEYAGISLYDMLDRIHEAHIPHAIDPVTWDRIDAIVATKRRKVAETQGPYGANSAPPADRESGVAELRERFRPTELRVLFVGESSPAQGAHFYRANSNLYRATRAAFTRVFGEDVVPNGEAFLRYFQDRGFWLVDLADAPVNKLSRAERRTAVAKGVRQLAKTIREAAPSHVVVVKLDIKPYIAEAISLADSHAAVTALPFPVRQWTRSYETGLAAFLSDVLAG